MNYLELVNMVRLECGVSNGDLTSLTGLVDEDSRIAHWVAKEWEYIQRMRPNWEWMKKSFSFNTVAGTSTYSPTTIGLTDFASWQKDSFRSWLVSAGQGTERFLDFFDSYDEFRDTWLFGTRLTTQSMPVAIAITPEKSLVLALVPNDIHTVTGKYFATPTVLSVATDEPNMPERFHMAIVYRAKIRYALFESAPEVLADGKEQWSEIKTVLELDQLPPVRF